MIQRCNLDTTTDSYLTQIPDKYSKKQVILSMEFLGLFSLYFG